MELNPKTLQELREALDELYSAVSTMAFANPRQQGKTRLQAALLKAGTLLAATVPAPQGTYGDVCLCGHAYVAHIPACDDMSGDEACKCKEFEPAAAPAEGEGKPDVD